MKVIELLFAVSIVLASYALASSEQNERLWISFTGPASGKFLMQIDSLGNIVLRPKRISEGPKIHPGHVTALSLNGTNALNLWFMSNGKDGRISRIVVNKKSLETRNVIQTKLAGLGGNFSSLNVTHRAQNNMITFPMQTADGIKVVAYALDEQGKLKSESRLLSPGLLPPSCDSHSYVGGAVSDGSLSYWVTTNPTIVRRSELFIQNLGTGGKPTAVPVLADKVFTQFLSRGSSKFTAVDATDSLGTKKFLVYIQQPSNNSEPERPKLLLQVIDAKTGAELSPPILIYRELEEFGGNAKVDPIGRFVLFITDEPPGLFYQSLDSSGHPSGPPKQLLSMRIAGIDLLREKMR